MATRRIVPRNDGEGSIGKPSKQWGDIQTKKINDKTPSEFVAAETPKEHTLDAHTEVTLAELNAKISDADLGPAYTLPTASAETLGGVKVADPVTVTEGVLGVSAATTSAAGLVELATDAEFDTGTDTGRVASVAQIRQMRTGWKNLLINGNFDVWQRGSTFTGLNIYTADRWRLEDGGGASSTVEKKQAFVDGAYVNVARITRINAVIGNFSTRIDEWRRLSGKTLTLSFWARGINAGFTTETYVSAYYGVSGSASDNLLLESTVITTDWQKYTYSFAVPDLSGKTFGDDSRMKIFLFRGSVASQTIEISQVQLELGGCATPFESRPTVLEKALCRPYCRVLAVHVPATATPISIPIDMRATPTITGGGTGFSSTGTTADTLICSQTTGAVQTLTLSAEL